MKQTSFRYTLLTCRFDQIWLPLALWGVFALVAALAPNKTELMNITRAYLGTAVPLVGGILAAYAILDDPALELRFATPVPAWQVLLERFGLIFAIQGITALSFELFALLRGGDFSVFLSGWLVQLAWMLPTLALMALGALAALGAAQSTTGALSVGLVWIVEVIARGWLARNAGKYVLVFMGALMPDHPDLLANHMTVFCLSLIFFYLAWALLRRQERYI
jgi:hypothetical protein